jgi:LysM repeat protein
MGQAFGILTFQSIELNNQTLKKNHDDFTKRIEQQHQKDMAELKRLNERLDKLILR